MKVADLFAALSLKVDKRSVKEADKAIKKTARKANAALNDQEKEAEKIRKKWRQRRLVQEARDRVKRRRLDAAAQVKRLKDRAAARRARFKRFNEGALAQAGTRAVQVGGGLAIAGIVAGAREAFRFEKALTALDVAGGGAMGTMADMRRQFIDVSRATGVSTNELVAGAQEFIALTGNGDAAKQSLNLFGRVAKATGASMGDIAASAASMNQNLGVTPDQMEKAFSIMIAGGKAGAIEMRDFAGLMASLTAMSKNFAGGTGTSGLGLISSALQIARQDFGSASEAATGMQSLMGSLIQNAGKFEKAGVKVFEKDPATGKKTLRGLQQIIESIGNSKLARDDTLLIRAFGRKEAFRAFQALTKVDGAWKGLAASTANANDVQQDFARVSESRAEQLSRAWNNVKLELAEAMTPERVEAMTKAVAALTVGVITAIQKFVKLGESLAEIAKFVSEKFGFDPQSEASKSAGRGHKLKPIKSIRALEIDAHSFQDQAENTLGIHNIFKARRLAARAQEIRDEIKSRKQHRNVEIQRIQAGTAVGIRRSGLPGTPGNGFNMEAAAARNADPQFNVVVNVDKANASPEEIKRAVRDGVSAIARTIAGAVPGAP